MHLHNWILIWRKRGPEETRETCLLLINIFPSRMLQWLHQNLAGYVRSHGFPAHLSVPRRFLPADTMPALFRAPWKRLHLLYMEGRSHAQSVRICQRPVAYPTLVLVGGIK